MPTTTALHITSLDRELRKDLERTIGKARKAAEAGAERALQGLGVHLGAAPAHLDKAGRDLRNALRAHGRQAGDVRDERTREQGTGHLVQEVAYAHWHRMLFARFLAENELLISFEYGVVVDLPNAAERAEALGLRDVWEYAAQCAQPMLPQIFPQGDPVLQLALPPETVGALTELLNALPPAVFTATDSLGWVYQFWQTERKKEVNDRTRAGQKVEADDISPVTQLFTEDYMVLFLLHNTLGAWWAGKRMRETAVRERLRTCAGEADCRAVVALPGVDWEYLRWRKLDNGSWTPAAGTFEKWPQQVKEVKVLDPCMGSGHFLVFALPMLVAMRRSEEALSSEEAVTAVLRDNLHGLELDPRCTQIAAFNLALAAWKLAGHQALPPLHLACSGMAPNSSREEWAAIAELAAAELSADEQTRMKAGMERLYDLFAQAPTLGSLIDPNRIAWDAFTMSPAQVLPLLEKAGRLEGDVELHERATAAQGLAKAAQLLAGKYVLVVTNVPYLGRNQQERVLMDYCSREYPATKRDLGTAMIERIGRFTSTAGTGCSVAMSSWFLQPRYVAFRKVLLTRYAASQYVLLGARAFSMISGERVNAVLVTFKNEVIENDSHMSTVDVSRYDTGEKAYGCQISTLNRRTIKSLLKDPQHIFTIEDRASGDMLSDKANSWQGIKTSDDFRFTANFWELDRAHRGWVPYVRTPASQVHDAGLINYLFWEDGRGVLTEVCQKGASFRGKSVWGKKGIAISGTGRFPATLYRGEKFSSDVSIIEPFDEADLLAIYEFCRDSAFKTEVRKISTSIGVTNSALANIPFNLEYWQKVAAEKYPNGLPEPGSDDPTQWLFHGHPALAEGGTQLQVAVARLLGYRWPPEHDAQMRLSAGARALVQESEKLLPFADPDGIVCLSAVHGEAPAYKRLQALLRAAYGGEWDPAQERALLAAAGHAEESLESWLRDSFFKEHCKLFHDRPFVWHVWDGRQDGFHALVNYHQLAAPNGGGRRTLEKLVYTYLGEWITRQEQAVEAGTDAAEARRAAAQKLRGELEKILNGEAPYDLFVRWKPLHQQAIGWEPDINDGVRLNIRPWLLAADVKAKGAGLLRHKPNIKWGKDRGKEPQRERFEYPWFWSWDERTVDFTGGDAFDGFRWNDLHYTLEAKRAARRQHEQP